MSVYRPIILLIVREILKRQFNKSKTLNLAIDRNQWRTQNIFVISLIWDKRAIPLSWLSLDKRGSSNISEQQALISPMVELLKDYEIIILGDREFGSVKLARWLCDVNVKFVLRIKQSRYIQQEDSEFTKLSCLGLLPGTCFFI